MSRRARILCLFLAVVALAVAQRRGGGRSFGGGGWRGGGESADDPTYTEGGRVMIGPDVRTPREIDTHSTGTPNWTNPKTFEKDVFTFTRVRRGRAPGMPGGSWATDTPDSDLNLSFRLQQMTSIKVNPDGRFLKLTDKDLSDHPFIYMVEPGSLYLSEEEIVALRKYLLNGGFLMLDDFWGDTQWANAEDVLKRVLPGHRFVELSLDHPLYHCVFEIKAKGQVPNYRTGERSQFDGVTWEDFHDGDTRTVHHRAIMDDKGRMMVIATHNTDNGDGWEREGEYDYYFHNFSEKIAYPLGVNIIFYAMTH
ncbi:MAG: hypothetical protein RLZZ15_4129 [Verrucomicrobiota bacterium]|jgi:hypothetical protein